MKQKNDLSILARAAETLTNAGRAAVLLLAVMLTMTAQTAWAASGDILVVDCNGGGQYTSISAAVADATGGETIFIKNGEYTESSTITLTKSLTFVGESQVDVIIHSGDYNLFFSTSTDQPSIVISKLTFKDISMTGARAPIWIGGDGDVTIEYCTFDNCESRYGAMHIFTSGTVTVDNCKFLGTKSSNGSYSSAIDFGGSGSADYTLKNSIIDGSTIADGGASYIFGAIYNEKSAGLVTLDNVTISNCNLVATGIISTKGNMIIKNSRIVNNNVYRDNPTAGLFFVNGAKDLTIETTVIADNSEPNYILSANSPSATYNLNYNNIQNNSFVYAFVHPDYGTYTLEANYWGSNTLPEGITATTWVVEDNGNYVLNDGSPLDKEIPGLSGGEDPEPVTYDLYVSPDGDGDGSSYETPTTLENIFTNMLVPEGGSVFLLNGEYYIDNPWMIGQSMSFVGESRDGVTLTGDNGGFIIGDPENPFNYEYSVGSVSFSKMTIESSSANFIVVPANMNDLTMTDCVFTVDGRILSVGYDISNANIVDATGTLNFNKNVVEGDDAIIAVGGQWDANINDNIFLNSNSGEFAVNNEEGVGTVNVDLNYWGSNDPATTLGYNDLIIATASANATKIYNDESATITIAMTLSDGTTNAKDDLPDYTIEATLTADGGDLSENSVTLQEGVAQVTYSNDVAGDYNIQIEILGQTLTVPITVKERYLGTIYVAKDGSDDNDGSEDAPVATVGKAIELALVEGGSGQIIINEGTYVGNDYQVTKDLTITGVEEGDVILDADNQGGLFATEYPTDATKIELKNLTLTKVSGSGAAVNSSANELILDNVTIVNTEANRYLIRSNGKLTVKDSNISNSKSGDVIQQTGNGDILIQNSVFEENVANDGTGVYAVIDLSSGSGDLVVEDSKFINNTVKQGVIRGYSSYNITVSGSEFVGNTNTWGGGAIYAYMYGKTLDVTDSKFINNTSGRDGGAIYIGWKTTATINKSVFINNSVTGTEHYGNAIYNDNSLTITNSVLLNGDDSDGSKYLIYNTGESATAQGNWWGTNDDPKDLVASGYDDWEDEYYPEVDVSDWVTMDAAFTPAYAQVGDEVTVTATFSNADLPDGIKVTFTSTSGNLNTDVLTEDAEASTTYTIDATDESITATSGSAVVEMPIFTNIVTQDNFYSYFDDSGILLDDVPFDELIFQGEFSDLAAGYVIITKPITITSDKENTGDKAVLNNMGFVIASENVTLDNMTLTATTSLGSLITVTKSNVDLTNLDISYIVEDEEAIAIDVRETSTLSDINISNNNIYFESHVSDDERYATAINLEDVEDVIIDGNIISASVPALDVKTYDYTYFMLGLVYVNPIRIYEASDLEFINNKVDVTVNESTSSYPTAQAMYLVGSEDVLIKGNDFTMTDTETPVGTSMYLYAVECGFSDGIEFINNNFDISTTGGKSGAGSVYVLQVATSEASFIGNNITSESNGPIVGIFSPYGFGRAKDLVIKENVLNITGLAAGSSDFALISGIEIQTGYATITNNTINVQNKEGYYDSYPVSGISAIQYSASTLSFDIQNNDIYVPDGKYAVELLYAPSEATVTGNALCAYELTGDDAVYIKSGDNNTVENNLLGYVMPKTGKSTYNIPANVSSFKVYDDGGQGRLYSPGCDGTLTLIAPTGYLLQLSGNIKTETGVDYLTVYDGSDDKADILINQLSSSVSGTETDIPTVTSTGQSLTFYFRSDKKDSDDSEFDGLDLTVTMIYNLNETDGLTAAINDELKGKTLNIMFSRTFDANTNGEGKASTLCLPFDLDKPSSNVATFYTFGGVSDATGEYVVTMNEVTDATLTGGTPYLIKPATIAPISFQNTAYEVPDDGFTEAGTTTDANGWEFRGIYEKETWASGQTRLYGFAAADFEKSDGTPLNDVGAFRRFDWGYCDAFRCYLWAPDPNAGARGATKSGSALPQSMRVILVAADGTTTGIGTLDTKTGDVTFDSEAWYSLDGRRLDGKPTKSGMYIHNGKKVLVP